MWALFVIHLSNNQLCLNVIISVFVFFCRETLTPLTHAIIPSLTPNPGLLAQHR